MLSIGRIQIEMTPIATTWATYAAIIATTIIAARFQVDTLIKGSRRRRGEGKNWGTKSMTTMATTTMTAATAATTGKNFFQN